MSDTRILRGAIVASLVFSATLASCGRPQGDEPWAHDAVELFEATADDLASLDAQTAGSRFGEHGTFDIQAWGGTVLGSWTEISQVLDKMLFISQRLAYGPGSNYPDLDVDANQVFLGTREAIVRFDAHDGPGVMPWMQLYEIGESSFSSRLFTEDLGHLDPWTRWTEEPEHEFYDQYIDVWSSGDERRLAEVYADAVEVRDALDGERWLGLGDLAGEMETSLDIEPGPWPELFRYDVGDRHEQIAVFQLGGSCPALEARRWVFDAGVIVDETRYAHVLSVRRCDGSAGDGWWTHFDITAPQEVARETTRIGGQQIEVVNASGRQVDFVRWLFDRYATGSLEQPEIAAVWFPPSVDCSLAEGIAKREDDRFEGGHTVTLCFTPDETSSHWPGVEWPVHVVHQGLHELAHAWMYDHLDDADRLAFLRRVGLDTWRGADVFWPERGVEAAAETIAWGLAGAGQAEYLIEPAPDCAELAARYRLLTGTEPLTTCDSAERG